MTERYLAAPKKLRDKVKGSQRKQSAIDMANTELEVEFERLEHSLGKAKGIGEKDKVLGRFLNRASSQQEYNIKARGQKPRVRKRGGTVSRKAGGKIMQGYKTGGKV